MNDLIVVDPKISGNHPSLDLFGWCVQVLICLNISYLVLIATSLAKPKNVDGVGYLSKAVILGYFSSPGFSLFSLNLNGNPTTITNKVMVMVFRAVSE